MILLEPNLDTSFTYGLLCGVSEADHPPRINDGSDKQFRRCRFDISPYKAASHSSRRYVIRVLRAVLLNFCEICFGVLIRNIE